MEVRRVRPKPKMNPLDKRIKPNPKYSKVSFKRCLSVDGGVPHLKDLLSIS